MSSFIGHSLAAFAIYELGAKPSAPKLRAAWLTCLVACASAPDIDYVVPALQSGVHDGIRITHSIAGSLALPVVVVVTLALFGARGTKLHAAAARAALAGLSHLMLDLLVGVTPAPLLWPLSTRTWKLPFGILPSAGRPQLSNPYFYRNLLIELGVLVPLGAAVFLLRSQPSGERRRAASAFGLLLVSLGCMLWASRLQR